MGDNLTKEQRSKCMSKIRSKNTEPERRLRTLLWKRGFFGYRLHAKVAGKPDIAFIKKKIAVFIDGCFWHKCPKCFKKPKTNNNYWGPKIERNVKRDKEINKHLKDKGWKVVRIWEHEINSNINNCIKKIVAQLK